MGANEDSSRDGVLEFGNGRSKADLVDKFGNVAGLDAYLRHV